MFGFRLSVKYVTGVLLAAILASGSTVAEAQSTHRTRRESNANRQARIARTIEQTYNHRWEVAGGGGYLRFRSGEYLQKNNEVTFWMTGTYYLNPKVGIIGDVRGLYGNAKVGNTIFNIANPQISAYPFMGGVAYRVYAKEKIAVSVTGEGGVALGKFDGGSKGIPSKDLGLWQSTTKPAFSIGANFDYNFYPNLAFRIMPTYVGTFYSLDPQDSAPQPHGGFQSNLGFNLGLVYRFGKIK
jgi:hypothetical protein